MKLRSKGVILGLSALMLAQLPVNHAVFLTAYAEEETSAEEERVLSGKCGENLTYELEEVNEDDEWRLVISGTGDMYDYEYYLAEGEAQLPPWYGFSVCELQIEEGVTGIGNYAFEGCFSQHNKISISLPKSLVRIGDFAFAYQLGGASTGLDLFIPLKVSYIGKGAFRGSLIGIENEPWKNFYVDSQNAYYCDVDGVLYSKDMKTLIAYPQNKNANEFVFPEDLLYIGAYAFNYNEYGFETLKLPEGLLGIGEYAFHGTPVGYNVILPQSLQTLGTGALYCFFSPLSSVIIPAGTVITGSGSPFALPLPYIYGYQGSDAERFMLENEIGKYEYEYKFKDLSAEDVFVLYDYSELENPAFPDGTPEVHYEDISENADVTAAMEAQDITSYIAYDITMQLDGEEVQPQIAVTVLISAADFSDTENLHVYRVEEDGSLTDMNAYVSNGFAVFETDHFSAYVLAELPAQEETSSEPETTEEQESKPDAETDETNETAAAPDDNQSADTGSRNVLLWYEGIVLLILTSAGIYAVKAGKER